MSTYLVADTRAATRALLALVRLARGTELDFSFGPMDAADIVQSGLQVRGSEDAVAKVLDEIPGVVHYD